MATAIRNEPVLAIAATATTTSAPTGASEGFSTGVFARVRTFLDYTGTVNACTLKLWLRDPGAGAWYEGATTDDLDPLSPGGLSPVDEVRDWVPGGGQEVLFQVSAISGGGTVAVRVQGVIA